MLVPNPGMFLSILLLCQCGANLNIVCLGYRPKPHGAFCESLRGEREIKNFLYCAAHFTRVFKVHVRSAGIKNLLTDSRAISRRSR